jgi:hypothetical protein
MMVERICILGGCVDSFVVNVWFGFATAVGTAAAAFIAWHQLSHVRREASIRATFDAVEFETSAEWREVLKTVRDFTRSSGNEKTLLARLTQSREDNGPEYRAVRALLARREYVALLLRSGGGDSRTYYLWCGDSIIDEWDDFRDYVYEVRKNAATKDYMENFEWMIEDYKARGTVESASRSIKTRNQPA